MFQLARAGARLQYHGDFDWAGLTFHGLPGLLADALPDKFGKALIDEYLSRRGVLPKDGFGRIEYAH